MHMSTPTHSTAWAILRQRCPRCYHGRVFRGSITMNETCPVCGLQFAREPGYFLGAMYFSYALGIPIISALAFVFYWFFYPAWPLWAVLGAAVVAFLPFVPAIFRYSRVIWLHFDRYFDAEE